MHLCNQLAKCKLGKMGSIRMIQLCSCPIWDSATDADYTNGTGGEGDIWSRFLNPHVWSSHAMLAVELHALLTMHGHTTGLSPLAAGGMHTPTLPPSGEGGVPPPPASVFFPPLKGAPIAGPGGGLGGFFSWIPPPR